MARKDAHTLPRTVVAGATECTLRLSDAADRDGILAMTRSLDEHDLLFLTRDMTQPDVVDSWLAEAETIRVLAVRDDAVLGYAAVHRSTIPWSLHVADLRILVSPRTRGSGLGRLLTQEAFALALSAGVEKMTAQMTLDQKAAIAVFEGLGFKPEALLRDQVQDRTGEKHDLVILSHDVARFDAQHQAFGMARAFGR